MLTDFASRNEGKVDVVYLLSLACHEVGDTHAACRLVVGCFGFSGERVILVVISKRLRMS